MGSDRTLIASGPMIALARLGVIGMATGCAALTLVVRTAIVEGETITTDRVEVGAMERDTPLVFCGKPREALLQSPMLPSPQISLCSIGGRA